MVGHFSLYSILPVQPNEGKKWVISRTAFVDFKLHVQDNITITPVFVLDDPFNSYGLVVIAGVNFLPIDRHGHFASTWELGNTQKVAECDFTR